MGQAYKGKMFQVEAATIDLLLTGRYRLQLNRVKYIKLCLICEEDEDEDAEHFFMECPATAHIVKYKITDLKNMYINNGQCPTPTRQESRTEIISTIINEWCINLQGITMDHCQVCCKFVSETIQQLNQVKAYVEIPLLVRIVAAH